jgi:hypothetical protein
VPDVGTGTPSRECSTVNLAADVDGAGASTVVAAAVAQTYAFNPLTTAAMAVVLCVGVFALRLVRRRVEDRQGGDGRPAAVSDQISSAPVEPTEPPTRR